MTEFLFLVAILYFVPTVIAIFRSHRNCVPVFLLNLLLGWTFIGWVCSLVWSFTDNTASARQLAAAQTNHPAEVNNDSPRSTLIKIYTFVCILFFLIAILFFLERLAGNLDLIP